MAILWADLKTVIIVHLYLFTINITTTRSMMLDSKQILLNRLEQKDGVLIKKQMKYRRQKQEPFYVKRIKLRHSVMKTNQILQSISIGDSQSRFHSSCRDRFNQNKTSANLRKSLEAQNTIVQSQLYNEKSGILNYERMHKLIKVCKTKQSFQKEANCSNMALDIRRLVGDPQRKKKTFPKEQETLTEMTKSRKKYRKTDYNTLQENRENPYLNDGFEEFPTCNSEFRSINSSMKLVVRKRSNNDRNEEKNTPRSPSKKGKTYLYEKMAGSENKDREETNSIYQRRISSYTQFLWKCMLAHSVYLNLDLCQPQLSIKKVKAFVGYGNNCNMIKGLLKRRFWWTVADSLTEDCVFVWTQLKVNKIYQRQEPSPKYQSIYLWQPDVEARKRQSKTCQPVKRKVIEGENRKNKKIEMDHQVSSNCKILTEKDQQALSSICDWFSWQNTLLSNKKIKEKLFAHKTKQIAGKMKEIRIINDVIPFSSEHETNNFSFYKVKPIVHNHLENNFHLGNKKALFYNLKEFYSYQNKDVFQDIPLTFHIKKGLQDPEYKRFIQFYEQRAKNIKRQQEREVASSRKMRNIWIVKPGENSNQGKGITVIDQIYQLNSIIKENQQSKKTLEKKDQASNTWIVQLYLDRPFLYYQRKFDIRHYMLITNLYGVTRAYWYEQGYIRTSSYMFNIHNLDPQIHLTNDSIQKRYPDYGKYQVANKVSYSEFQSYLKTYTDRKYDFKKDILEKMKNIGKDAVRSVCNKIDPNRKMNNFQIFGLDFMIDRSFKPWLIEINTNPCLDCVCPLLDRIIPYMVEQSLKLSLDLVYPPPCHYPNSAKHYAPFVDLDTFKYDLIFDSSSSQKLDDFCLNKTELLSQIGEIGDDEVFNDNGKEIRLEEFT